MARGGKYRKYSRRTSRSGGGAKIWIVILAILAFLALSLIISVMIGISLGKRAEGDDAPRLDIDTKEYYSGDKKISPVDAYIYNDDFDVSRIWSGDTDFSLCLRDSEGRSAYSLVPGVALGEIITGERDLAEHTEYIKEYGGRVCAYMWADLREDIRAELGDEMAELYLAYDAALAKYASECGVYRLMLILPAVTAENIAALESYVNMISLSAGDMAVGVLMDSDTYLAVEDDKYYASRLRARCDFAALDMRETEAERVEAELAAMAHYIKMYDLTLVFAEGQSDAERMARELGAENIQTVKN